MLTNIKLLLGIPDDSKDDILNQLIQIAGTEFKDITHTNAVIDDIVIQMVIYRFNRLKTEGLESETYTGIDFTYELDYPEYLKKQILSHRKIRTI